MDFTTYVALSIIVIPVLVPCRGGAAAVGVVGVTAVGVTVVGITIGGVTFVSSSPVSTVCLGDIGVVVCGVLCDGVRAEASITGGSVTVVVCCDYRRVCWIVEVELYVCKL